MDVDLEAQCTATHEWVLIAKFRLAIEALDTARALSKLNRYPYRTIDRRWPEEGDLITIINEGEVI
jgi:hypothetical protein